MASADNLKTTKAALTRDTENNGFHLEGRVFCGGCGSPAELPEETMYRLVVSQGTVGNIVGHLHLCGCCGGCTFRPVVPDEDDD